MFEAVSLRDADVKAEQEALREAVAKLPDPERALFFRDFNAQLKDPDTYAVLNWLLLAGLHHFYLGRLLRGLVNLAVMLVGIGLLILGYDSGLVLIVLILLVELPALFRSQTIVMDYNNRLGRRILATYLPQA